MYIIKSKGPRIDPCGTPCFIVPQFEEKFISYAIYHGRFYLA
jgi:hypothetical protein